LADQEQAALLVGERSRRVDIRVLWHRHISEVHAAAEEQPVPPADDTDRRSQ
jgi:hypothetical protein